MPEWIELLVSILFVYRLARIITNEDGPGKIFFNIREAVYKRYGYDSWQAEGARCILCQSVWYSVFPAYYYAGGKFEFILLWFAISGGVVILFKLSER